MALLRYTAHLHDERHPLSKKVVSILGALCVQSFPESPQPHFPLDPGKRSENLLLLIVLDTLHGSIHRLLDLRGDLIAAERADASPGTLRNRIDPQQVGRDGGDIRGG